MKTLKPTELRTIEQFFQLKQENLLKIMNKYLQTKYDTIHYTSDYIVAVGNIPVALVAHLDTVFAQSPEDIFYDRAKNVMWSPEGLGADDRAGVYAIVQLLKKGYRPTVIFTTDEEVGALGASELIRDFPTPMTDLKYIIQLDRRGSVDCVFYDCNNPAFEEYIETFGFVTAHGTFSDISVICPAWKVAGVNLSIGYVNEHSLSEMLYIGNMIATIEKVEKMLQDAYEADKYEYIPLPYSTKWRSLNSDYFAWDPSYGVPKSTWDSWCGSGMSVLKCEKCGEKEYDYNLFAVKMPNGTISTYCPECVSEGEQVGWCRQCGEPFLLTNKEEIYCYECLEKGINNDGTNTRTV